ncbi:MAG: M15 family metallopeptidase [Treponema sp.]|nr:M15 family metallopeptidase [Treponema sp.]
MFRKTTVILLIIIIGIIYSCGSKPAAAEPEEIIEEAAEEAAQEVIVVPEPTRAELVMRALLEAYPEQIEEVEFRNDDWAVLLKGKWYYYANGRILQENKAEDFENFRSYQFYGYPAELPPWRERTPEETARFGTMAASRRQITVRRSNDFLDDLWQASTRAEAERNIVTVTFLGRSVKINKLIQKRVIAVERDIRAAARADSGVQTWINSIDTLEGYVWRNVADTQSRSYHAYGIALDILSRRTMGNLQTYWLWTSQYRDDWWNVSYRERYHPPDAVIKAFEANGFIWGGKWLLFDTMHFEYRPELLILSGMTLNAP